MHLLLAHIAEPVLIAYRNEGENRSKKTLNLFTSGNEEGAAFRHQKSCPMYCDFDTSLLHEEDLHHNVGTSVI